jgi:hypothetical protein
MYLKGEIMPNKKETDMINEFRRYIIQNWDKFHDIEKRLGKNQRLLLRNHIAEQGQELTPNEVDQIVGLIISIKQNITPFDLIWDIAR